MQGLDEWLSEKGFNLVPVLNAGKILRCDRNGGRKNYDVWYVGGEGYDKNGVLRKWFVIGDWSTDEKYTYPEKNGVAWTSEEIEFYHEKQREAAKLAKEENEKRWEEGKKTATALWNSGVESGVSEHPYIVRKKISYTKGVRLTEERGEKILLIPVYDKTNELCGIQRIWASGEKRFTSGTKPQGSYFVLGESNDGTIAVSEGYATGASIHEATGLQVYCAFNAGNLQSVACFIRSFFQARIIICGDDDRWKDPSKNPGEEKAQSAARSCGGIAVFPKFTDVTNKPTDFNDLFVLEGSDEVRRQIEWAIESIPASGNDLNWDSETGPRDEGYRPGDIYNGQGARGPATSDVIDAGFSGKGGKEDGGKGEGRGELDSKNIKSKPAKKKISQKEIEALGKEILDCRFKLYVDSKKSILYNITDIDKKEIEICDNEDYLIRRLKTNIEEKWKKVYDESFIKKVYSAWRLATLTLRDIPKSFAWENEDDWSFKRLDFYPQEGNFPSWKEFLDRLSSPEDFMSFVWSIFELKNKSRQFLYMVDPIGEGGKSTVIRSIGSVLGNSFTALSNNMVNGSGVRWLMGEIFGKRLVAWSDCKNPRFCMSEIVRNITSGDPVNVEFKGQNPFSTVMYAKLIIGSNHEPQITSGGADTSRLIVIHVGENKSKKDDPDWEDRLRNELPYFLYKCREVYKTKCPKNGKIELSEKTVEMVESSTEAIESKWDDLMARRITIGDGLETSVSEWLAFCNDERLENHEIGNFKDFLKRFPGVEIKRHKVNGVKKSTYKGFKVRPKTIWG